MNTPVLIIAFNRPETLAVLLKTLRERGADNLFFAVDGPRAHRSDDAAKVDQVKGLIRELYSPEASRCLYQTQNLGIRQGPPAAITWFFEQVEEGVILEDDCIPGESFFPFVNWALQNYRHQDAVKLVSGFNRFSPSDWPESHRFIKTAMIWGWASWRRAWKDYDPEMLSWDNGEARRRFRRWAEGFPVYDYWRVAIEWVRAGRLVTWDVAWCWSVFESQGLAVFPRVSLIRNIGFGADSTNTQLGDRRAFVTPGILEAPYSGPSILAADLKVQRKIDQEEFWRTDDTWGGRIRRVLRAWRRRLFAGQP